MATVLVTAAGSDICIGAIQSLQKTDHRIVAVDMNPRAAGLYLADEGRVVPPATDDNWPQAMKNVVTNCKVDVVIPLIDQELRELRRLRPTLPENVSLVVPRQELIEMTIDKLDMYDYFDQKGLQIPDTVLGSDVSHLDSRSWPQIVKPRRGQGSRGVSVLRSPDSFEQYIDCSEYEPEEVLLQDFVDGREFTSNVTVTGDNRLLSIVSKEVPERDGYTAWGVTKKNEDVRDACREAYRTLAPKGPMNVQHMIDEDGMPYLIEINTRFSGSSCLTVESGINEFDLLIRDALGEEVEPPTDYETGLNMIRYTDQLYIGSDELLTEFDSES